MINYFSLDLLCGMLLSGAKHVINNEAELNRVNVFPVADKDTGTNLASMMRYVVENFTLPKELNQLTDQIANLTLIGCSGNSGLIFSQFFYGLSTYKIIAAHRLQLNEFAIMLKNGFDSAYNSVSQPQVGTVLTVMDYFAQDFTKHLNHPKNNLLTIFGQCLDNLKIVLANTTKQLEILEQNHVVDAGALGFVCFIQGMYDYLSASKEQKERLLNEQLKSDTSRLSVSDQFEELSTYPNYRFCFETIIKTEQYSILAADKNRLHQFGDSLVLGQGHNLVKVHIHTDQPQQLSLILTEYGDIIYQKVDDMQMQYNMTQEQHKNQICILCDSLADLPQEWLQKNHIFSFPLQVKVNNNTFLDKLTITHKQSLGYLLRDNNKVCTSAPSAAIISRGLHFLEQFYSSFIVLTVARALSSTYDVVNNQIKKFNESKMTVIDSCSNSGALGLLVIYAYSLVKQNKFSHEVIVQKIEAIKQNTNMLIFVSSLESLIKSGRLSKGIGWIAKIIRMKPIIKLDHLGKPKIIAVVFSRKSALRTIAKYLNKIKEKAKLGSLAVIHSSSNHKAQMFSDYLYKKTKIEPLYITEVSSVSGVHTGNNGLAVAYCAEIIKMG